jgi:hypothetical protein
MKQFFTSCLGALCAALWCGACGASGADDDATHVDAGDDDDGGLGGGPLADIAGMWRFTLTRPGLVTPELDCTVHLTGSTFEVTCPGTGFPTPVETGCMQLREDAHLAGSVQAGLSGSVDWIVEYAGESCAGHGYTTGAPYPTPPWAVMSAAQLRANPLPLLLPALGGKWVWTLSDSKQPVMQTGCSVALDPGKGVAIAITIDCPTSLPKDVALGCQQQEYLEIGAGLGPMALAGTLTPVTRNTGAGCGSDYPPEERGESTILEATPLAAR